MSTVPQYQRILRRLLVQKISDETGNVLQGLSVEKYREGVGAVRAWNETLELITQAEDILNGKAPMPEDDVAKKGNDLGYMT